LGFGFGFGFEGFKVLSGMSFLLKIFGFVEQHSNQECDRGE